MHKVFGSTYMFNIPIMGNRTKLNQQGSFTHSSIKTHYLDLAGGRRCEENPRETMEACVANYMQQRVGCRLGVPCIDNCAK